MPLRGTALYSACGLTEPPLVSRPFGNDRISQELRATSLARHKRADRVSPIFMLINRFFAERKLGDTPPGSALLCLATPVFAKGQGCMRAMQPISKEENEWHPKTRTAKAA